jgi:DNA-binding FadR family transcriptional regulator
MDTRLDATPEAAPAPATPLLTVGDIAAALGSQVYSVRYAISTRQIKETQWAGRTTRLFDAAAVERIRAALAEIQAAGTDGAAEDVGA